MEVVELAVILLFLRTVLKDVSFLFASLASSRALFTSNGGCCLTIIETGVVVLLVLTFIWASETFKSIKPKRTVIGVIEKFCRRRRHPVHWRWS